MKPIEDKNWRIQVLLKKVFELEVKLMEYEIPIVKKPEKYLDGLLKKGVIKRWEKVYGDDEFIIKF